MAIASSSFSTFSKGQYQDDQSKPFNTKRHGPLASRLSPEDLQETPSIDTIIHLQQKMMQQHGLDGSNMGEYILSMLTQWSQQYKENLIYQYPSNATSEILQTHQKIQQQISQSPNQQEQQWISRKNSLYILQNTLSSLLESKNKAPPFQEAKKIFKDLQCKLSASIKQINRYSSTAGLRPKVYKNFATTLTIALKEFINSIFEYYTSTFPERTMIIFFHLQHKIPVIYVTNSPFAMMKNARGPDSTASLLTLMQCFIQNGCNLDPSTYIPSNDMWQEIVCGNVPLKKTLCNPFARHHKSAKMFAMDFLIKTHNIGLWATAIKYKTILLEAKLYLAWALSSFPINIDREEEDDDTTLRKLQDTYSRPASTDKHDIRDMTTALCVDDILFFSYPKIKITTIKRKMILIHALQQIMQGYKIEQTTHTYLQQYQHTYIQSFFQQCQDAHQEEAILKCIDQLRRLISKHHQQCRMTNNLFKKHLPNALCNAIISIENTTCPTYEDFHEKICQHDASQQTSIQRCIVYLHHEITVLHNYDVLFYLRSLNKPKDAFLVYQLQENRQKIKSIIDFLLEKGENLQQLEIFLWRAHQEYETLRYKEIIQFSPKGRIPLPDATCMQRDVSHQRKTNIMQQQMQQQTILLQNMVEVLFYIYELLLLLRPEENDTFWCHFFSSSCDSFTYIAKMFSLNEKLPHNVQRIHDACMKRIALNRTQSQENTTSYDQQEEDEEEISSLKKDFEQQEISQQVIPLLSDFPFLVHESSPPVRDPSLQKKGLSSQQNLSTIAASVTQKTRNDDHAQSQENITSYDQQQEEEISS